MITIRKAELKDLPVLEEAAHADRHSIAAVTQIIEKAGEMVGYISLDALPLAVVWFHSEKMKARDSYEAVKWIEWAMAQKKTRPQALCVPCNVLSPLLPYMPKLGYLKFGTFDFFAKAL